MIELRLVREEDCQLLWEWANDPEVRAVSFSPDPISWDEHLRWFRSKVGDANCKIYVATDGQMPVGEVRYDVVDDRATISIIVAPQFRGRGYGSEIIRRASQQVLGSTTIRTIHAFVKKDNLASLRAFVKADYESIGSEKVNDQIANHLILRRNGEDDRRFSD